MEYRKILAAAAHANMYTKECSIQGWLVLSRLRVGALMTKQ